MTDGSGEKRAAFGTGAGRLRLILAAVLSLVFLAAGIIFYRNETKQIRQDNYRDLRTVAAFKVRQIQQWRQERLTDVTLISRSPAFLRFTEKLSREARYPDMERELRMRLELERTDNVYSDVLLISPQGRTILSLEARPTPLSDEARQAIGESLGRRSAALSELYRATDGRIYLDVVAPVMDGDRLVAVVVYRVDAGSRLYPMVTSWPGPGKSAETLLVRRDGGDVLVISEAGHRRNAALSLRYPLTRTDIPAVQAVLGREGMFVGRDYREVEVMADIRRVPGSPWYMVAKIDMKEVLAEARHRAWFISLVVFLLLLINALMVFYAYRRRDTELYKALYRSEREQRESFELFRTMLYSIGDAVITADVEGAVGQMNPTAEKLTGWSESEARGRPIGEVFHIVNEKTRAEAESPVAHVLRAGTIVGLANHTVLISREGTERPIADSGAPIRDQSGKMIGVVMVFRDQTEERNAAQRLIDSKASLDLALQSAGMGEWCWDIGEDRRRFDDQVCHLLGLDPAAYTGTAEEFYNLVHPDDLNDVQESFGRVLREDTAYSSEYRVIRPDGNIRHIAARGRLVRDDDNGQRV
jgi:PAS domain S-box-containing protein